MVFLLISERRESNPRHELGKLTTFFIPVMLYYAKLLLGKDLLFPNLSCPDIAFPALSPLIGTIFGTMQVSCNRRFYYMAYLLKDFPDQFLL